MIGYEEGWLSIFDLQKNQTLKNIEVMLDHIYSVHFLRDNQTAFINDYIGNIKLIKWKADANSGDDFDFTEERKGVGLGDCCSMCLTKDEKYLLVGSNKVLSLVEIETRKVTKEFKLKCAIQKISLIQDGKKALIAGNFGNLSILDLETLEISLIAENITDGKYLLKITVI